MSDKPILDMDKIAAGLGAERQGFVYSTGGPFGSAQLVAEVQARFHVPARGGRGSDPGWTERRLLPLTPATLSHLRQLSKSLKEQGVTVSPLQVAALLLERALDNTTEGELVELAQALAGEG